MKPEYYQWIPIYGIHLVTKHYDKDLKLCLASSILQAVSIASALSLIAYVIFSILY
jgi:hypothetical protein